MVPTWIEKLFVFVLQLLLAFLVGGWLIMSGGAAWVGVVVLTTGQVREAKIEDTYRAEVPNKNGRSWVTRGTLRYEIAGAQHTVVDFDLPGFGAYYTKTVQIIVSPMYPERPQIGKGNSYFCIGVFILSAVLFISDMRKRTSKSSVKIEAKSSAEPLHVAWNKDFALENPVQEIQKAAYSSKREVNRLSVSPRGQAVYEARIPSVGRDTLNSFLGDLHDAEGKVSSTGKWTLDLHKAREKLRKFQLAEPCFYLMKIVQAVVSAGAQRIDIHLGRTSVRLLAQMPGQGVFRQAQDIVGHLGDPQGAPQGPFRHLAIGLNSAWSADPHSVEWRYWSCETGKGWTLKVAIEDIEVVDSMRNPSKVKTPGNVDLVEFTLNRHYNYASLAQGAAAEHAGVVHRCAFCPVPIYLDSHRLVGQWSPAELGDSQLFCRPYYVAERFVGPGTGPSTFRICAPLRNELRSEEDLLVRTAGSMRKKHPRIPSFSYQFKDLATDFTDTIVCRMAIALPVGAKGISRLFLVKDGVTLEPLQLNLGMDWSGVQAILAADDVQTDLSEFRAMQDGALYQCEGRVRIELNNLLKGLKPLESSLPYFPYSGEPPTSVKGSDRSGLASLSCGLFGILIGHGMVMSSTKEMIDVHIQLIGIAAGFCVGAALPYLPLWLRWFNLRFLARPHGSPEQFRNQATKRYAELRKRVSEAQPVGGSATLS